MSRHCLKWTTTQMARLRACYPIMSLAQLEKGCAALELENERLARAAQKFARQCIQIGGFRLVVT